MKAWGVGCRKNLYNRNQGFYQEMCGFPVMFFAWTSNYGWFIVENPIKMDDLEVRPFQENTCDLRHSRSLSSSTSATSTDKKETMICVGTDGGNRVGRSRLDKHSMVRDWFIAAMCRDKVKIRMMNWTLITPTIITNYRITNMINKGTGWYKYHRGSVDDTWMSGTEFW